MKSVMQPLDTAQEKLFEAFKPHAKSFSGLRNRVLGRLLMVALIPIFILAFYYRYQFLNTLESQSELFLQTIAKGRQSSVDQMIANKMAALKSLSGFILPNTPTTDQEMKGFLAFLQRMDATILFFRRASYRPWVKWQRVSRMKSTTLWQSYFRNSA